MVVCIGRAEYEARFAYNLLSGSSPHPKEKEFIDFFAKNKTTFVGASELLMKCIRNRQKSTSRD